LVRRILEYGAAFWDPCREVQINALDRAQTKSAVFTNHTKFLTGKPWFGVGGKHAYVYFLQRTLGNGLVKLHATDCEGLTL